MKTKTIIIIIFVLFAIINSNMGHKLQKNMTY